MTVNEKIRQGKIYLGIELGSTRIKATLTDDTFSPVASGSHNWENRLENGYWTYSLEDIHGGVKSCYADLKKNVSEKYGVTVEKIAAIGISAMMHGYMAFDKGGRLLVPFRTWRNTTTEKAASELTELFGFNIPQRWSIAHLYQAVLNGEPHLSEIGSINTLAGYIHYLLTGKRILGIGDASGMFPIDGGKFNEAMLDKFSAAASRHGFNKDIRSLLPEIMTAGEIGGALTKEGALFLDPDGDLQEGTPLCPPEGDAGTGMTATNSVLPKTGNISAGTSVFSMLVLEKPLKGVYPEIDIVTTPTGDPVAMVHCNNCCSELDAWVKLFGEVLKLSGQDVSMPALYDMLYRHSLNGSADCGGIAAYNCLSGEPVINVDSGRPMYFRTPDSKMNLANFFRAQIYTSVAALKSGMDILFGKEQAAACQFVGHGGLFKTEGVAQQFLADALNTPISVMKTAGEGGSWGIALLAAYTLCGKGRNLADWLDSQVFADMEKKTAIPDEKGSCGFKEYMKLYNAGLAAERKLGDV
ncbi:MAG: FGGY-family carbohydrate kinase [Firmicutes bacterium]|nr:FGGY-family carbohydrate kinase [[Eubacterium] siraeum]MCM1487838.1 FGGY-family carbohydrate kinase [Bacillota bacterium]